jgi:hypothetical protein
VSSKEVTSTVDPILQTDLTILLTNDGNDTDDSGYPDSSTFSLKHIQDLKIILRDVPFAFAYFQRTMEKLMFRWAHDNIPTLQPLLERFKTSLSSHANNHDDQSHYSMNRHKQQQRRGRQNQRKERTRNNDGMTNDDTYGANAITDEEQQPFKRQRKAPVKFTQEEKDAIKDGVQRIGLGRWSEIRDAYPVLHHRTYSKAIKVSCLTCSFRCTTPSNRFQFGISSTIMYLIPFRSSRVVTLPW